MPALGNIVNTITQTKLFPAVTDNFYEGNVLFMRLRGKKKSWSTGRQLVIPTELIGRTQLGSYSGADTFGTAQEDVRRQFTINPSQYYANVTLTGIQVAANKGPMGIIDLITAEMTSVGKALPDEMGNDVYLDGTGNSSKAITGLAAHVDDGTTVTTYEGLSRTTYSKLNSTVSTQSGALTLANMAATYDAAQIGSDAPTLFITTPAVFSIYEALLTQVAQYAPTVRYKLTASGMENGSPMGNAGFVSLMYRGVPVVSDDKTPSGVLYALNENYLDIYEMEPDGLFANGTREGFGWTGWKKSINQDVITSQLIWYGQLVGTQPRKQAKRISITS